MELVSQQRAGQFTGRVFSSGLARSTSKVEIFTDPGMYDGSKSKFEDWWMKIQAWLDSNPKQFSYIDTDGNEIINGKNCIYAILSHLKRAKGSHFTEVELQKLAARNTCLHNWDTY